MKGEREEGSSGMATGSDGGRPGERLPDGAPAERAPAGDAAVEDSMDAELAAADDAPLPPEKLPAGAGTRPGSGHARVPWARGGLSRRAQASPSREEPHALAASVGA